MNPVWSGGGRWKDQRPTAVRRCVTRNTLDPNVAASQGSGLHTVATGMLLGRRTFFFLMKASVPAYRLFQVV